MSYIKSKKHPVTLAQTTVGAAVSAALLLPAVAMAADNNLPEVVVKAKTENEFKADKAASPKYTQPLVDTPMTAGRGRRKLAPADAARQLLDGVRAGRDDVYVGPARMLPLLQRWAPGVLARVMQRGG